MGLSALAELLSSDDNVLAAIDVLNKSKEVERAEEEVDEAMNVLMTFLDVNKDTLHEVAMKTACFSSRVYVGSMAILQLTTAVANKAWWADSVPDNLSSSKTVQKWKNAGGDHNRMVKALAKIYNAKVEDDRTWKGSANRPTSLFKKKTMKRKETSSSQEAPKKKTMKSSRRTRPSSASSSSEEAKKRHKKTMKTSKRRSRSSSSSSTPAAKRLKAKSSKTQSARGTAIMKNSLADLLAESSSTDEQTEETWRPSAIEETTEFLNKCKEREVTPKEAAAITELIPTNVVEEFGLSETWVILKNLKKPLSVKKSCLILNALRDVCVQCAQRAVNEKRTSEAPKSEKSEASKLKVAPKQKTLPNARALTLDNEGTEVPAGTRPETTKAQTEVVVALHGPTDEGCIQKDD